MRVNGIGFNTLRTSYHYSSVEISDEKHGIEIVPDSFFGGDWRISKEASRTFGSHWFGRGRGLFLGVKSAVLSVELNYVANAAHPGFKKLKFAKPQTLPLDSRL